MPVSSRGYVYRLKFLPLPFDAKRYACLPVGRGLLTLTVTYAIFIVCEWPNDHGQLPMNL